MGIATQYEGGLRFEGDQMYITTGSSTIMTIKSGGTIQLPQYSAGLLQTDASGNVSVDTSSYLTSYTETDTLNSVVGRGASTTSAITVGGITSGNASLNGTVQLGGFNGNNEDQWPIVQWYRDTTNNWDEGLIKASSNRGFFSTSHFGIHFDDARAFGFFTSSWTKVLGISSSKVLSEVDLEIGSGETLIHGELRLGTHPVHSGYTGLWNTEASTTTTEQYLIISAGTDTYVNGDTVYIRGGNNSTTNQLAVGTGGTTIGGNTVWHAGNDGSGSGLDADTLDGQHGSSFLRSNAADSFDGTLSWGGSAGADAFDLNNSDIEDARGVRAREFTQLASGVPRNNLGDPTVTEMALFDSQFRCMTDLSNNYNDLTDLRFYVQTTSASEWEEITTYSDDQKRRFLRTNNSSVDIPNGAYKFRVEFNASGYTFANAIYFYWSSQSHSTQVHIWKQRASDDQWFQHTSSTNYVSSWPGHLWMPFSTIPWLEDANSTSTGHYHKIRVEFIPSWQTSNQTYADRPIRLSGGQIWGGYPSGRRTPHYYDQNGKLFTWGDFEVNGKLYIDTRDANTSSTTALVMNGNEVEQRTLGSAAFSTSTDFVAVGGDQMTGTLEIKNTAPIIKLNDSDATNTTNLIAYITLQTNGTEKGWVGYGSSGNSDLTIRNNDGRVVLTGSSSYVSTSLDVSGAITNSGGAKINVQNQQDGGTGRGIYMWDDTDTNWVIYMAQSGDGKAADGGPATAGIDGTTQHAIRFRVNDNSSQSGFIWENSSDEALMQLNGGSGTFYTIGKIYPSNQTTDYVDSTRIQNWQTAYGWGNHGSAGYLTSVDWTDIGAGTRTNYTLKFKPPANSYAGFQFIGTDNQNAGYFLIRGTSDNDVYGAEGITLVADQGWLTLAQRYGTNKGVRFMTGSTTASTRMTIATDGDVNINNSLTVGADLGVNGFIKDSLYKHSGNDYWRTKKYVRSVGVTGGDISGTWVHLTRVALDAAYEKATIKFTINGYDDVSSGVEAIDVRYENGSASQENHQMAWYSTDDHANLFSEVRSIRSSSSGLSNTYDLYVKMAGDWRDTFTVVAEQWTTHGDSTPITFMTSDGTATEPQAGSDDKGATERRWYTENAFMYLKGNRVYTTGDFSTSDFATASHSHSAATTSAAGFMSSTDKSKLDGIASGAEVNVQSDWNATSGDAFIQNKPTLGTAAATASTDYISATSADTAADLITFNKGISADGNSKFYNWRALDNTSSTSNSYWRIARITSSQSSRFMITLAGRSTSYSDGTLPAMGHIVGQLNNDNNYDVVFYNHSTASSEVVTEVGIVNVSNTVVDVYVKAGQFAELTATGHISDGSFVVYSNTGGDGNTTVDGYVAVTEYTVMNTGNSDVLFKSGGTMTGDILLGANSIAADTTSPTAHIQVGAGTTNTGNRSDVALLGESNSGGVVNALGLVNTAAAANSNGVALNFHNANNYSPTGQIVVQQNSSGTTTHSAMKFYTYGANNLTHQMSIKSDGVIRFLSYGAGLIASDANGNLSVDTNTYLTGIANNSVGITQLNVSDGSAGQVLTTDGSGNLSFTTVSGGSSYTLPAASSSALGGVKIGYTANAKNYPVQLDASNKAYVNVPWTDANTTYSAGSGLDLSSGAFSVEPDLRDGITHIGKDANNYITFDSTNGHIDFYAGGNFVARMEADGDLHIKGDVIAFSTLFA